MTLKRAGAWPAAVRLTRGGLTRATALTLARGFAPELLPDAHAGSRLAAVAAAGGGAMIDGATALAGVRGGRATLTLWPWLVGLAAALWPLDVRLQLGSGSGTARPAGARRRKRDDRARPAHEA
ncbi:MAG: hypothetical protein U0470_13865 [Anaerolineae bacterium]